MHSKTSTVVLPVLQSTESQDYGVSSRGSRGSVRQGVVVRLQLQMPAAMCAQKKLCRQISSSLSSDACMPACITFWPPADTSHIKYFSDGSCRKAMMETQHANHLIFCTAPMDARWDMSICGTAPPSAMLQGRGVDQACRSTTQMAWARQDLAVFRRCSQFV